MKPHWQTTKRWQKIAKSVGYRVGEFARALGQSPRQLYTYCQNTFRKRPHQILAKFRSLEIVRQKRAGKTGKQMLSEVGLSHDSSLNRALNRDMGGGLRDIR